MYQFRIEVNNLKTVQGRITKPGDVGFQEITPKGNLGFLERSNRVKILTEKAGILPDADDAITYDEIKELGKLLFDILFDGEVRANFWKYYKEVRNNHSREKSNILSIELVFDESAEGVPLLASLPWEFLYASDPQKENLWLVYAPAIRLARWCRQDKPLKSIRLFPGKPLRIAIAVTEFDPKILERHNLGQVEAGSVRKKLNELSEYSNGKIELIDFNQQLKSDECFNIKTLDRLLKKFQPHIFHFVGHGRFVGGEAPHRGQVALSDSIGNPDWINDEQFCEIFGEYRPPVVILQSCQGGARSTIFSDTGISSKVLSKDVLVVVAMQYEISNITANTFAENFYDCLAHDFTVKDAVQEARRVTPMELRYETREFATPMLYVNRCEDDSPFYRDSELEALWQILVDPHISNEIAPPLLDELNADLGRRVVNGFPPNHNLPDWIADLRDREAQNWDLELNRWNYSFTENVSMHPLLWLIEQIAGRTSKAISESLRNWNDKNLGDLNTTPLALQKLREHLEDFSATTKEPLSFLLITISPQDLNEKTYFVHTDYYYQSVWHQPEGKFSVSSENLQSKLSTLLGELGDLNLPQRHTNIGFLVPSELMSFPFEYIEYGSSGLQLRMIFPVIIGAYGRDQVPYQFYMDQWLDKWKSIKKSMGMKASEIAKEFDDTLFDSVKNVTAFSETIFPVIKCAPSKDFSRTQTKWTDLLYENGICVALWLRTTDDDKISMLDFEERIVESLLSKEIDDFPVRLKEMRKNSYRFVKDIGNHLVLLWDNPELLPNYDNQASNEI